MSNENVAFLHTPLCPAVHLPRKGGDWQLGRRLPPHDVGDWRKPRRQLISPLAGEMPGRAEGVLSRRPIQLAV
ncbi:hypothetical protein EN828_20280 [Mesorhizobium sp. M2D.F.Ca.ET.185.01.1.1]|nr:hypothetical protein EN783_13235 [Mesorhizobium sp. M2D.F.Ca.ET.140.01.1.1]TGP16182.1 hypothetical protein EN876_19640 [Mesorhizobium sp. M2D.F.Ca.ET.233.01.1.1]TGP32709.1 hypothetical protein EN875_018525 [Mesorhizobium sp. M2D.F.Ca.ET.232.01.1.1]TGP58203.1 hypothetical protein EN869_020385 [Mesorhizobium sp. M2D.F.Ca.ET.226.01.1.1]TGP67294.1 hypothetical protein EN868_18955 [Mesorhizobium sp. M2D.F.Ca.ET.225.01.1.1]TGP76205.1 hypothetical protein EN867_16760 [Mesorhizobium sp. M2D.F.Ca.ET